MAALGSVKPTVLVVGCGDVGLRVLKLLRGRVRLLALTSTPARVAELRAAGAVPLIGDLDQPATLRRLAGLADRVLHLAPPPGQGRDDPRTRHLLAALARSPRACRLVYASTTGVYGDAGGARFDESRPVAPATDRAWRRVAAERACREWVRRRARQARPASAVAGAQAIGRRSTLLRIPGIYAFDRPGGDPRERLAKGLPVLRHEDDVYTNHIHADDLARACVAALFRGGNTRVLHVCDDRERRMGEHFDLVADHLGLPRPARLTRAEAAQRLSPMQLSFWSESRRLVNRRLKQELRLALRYPGVEAALAQLQPAARLSG